MKLESSVLSDAKVQEQWKNFVWVKVDPREVGGTHPAMVHKSTRYVPEVVFLSPEGEVLSRLEDRTVEGTLQAMRQVLESRNVPRY